jgi:hypothetical protein
MARLERLFNKWIDASKTKKDYNGLRTLLLREAFYERCGANLEAHLREREIVDVKEVVTSAQRYIDAHNYKWGKKATTDQKEKPTNNYEDTCGICKKTGHTDEDCWFKQKAEGNEKKCFRCGSSDHLIKACTKEKVIVGSSSVKQNNSLQGKFEHVNEKTLTKVLNVPMSKGTVNGITAMVMRDTGFGNVAVKSKYVKEGDYLDEYEDVLLMDCTPRRFQKAVVELSTDHYKGELKVLVVESLVVDCVVGNIRGLEDADNRDKQVTEEVSAAVITRAQEKELKKPSKKPHVVVEESNLVDRDTFMQRQKEDISLAKYRDLGGVREESTRVDDDHNQDDEDESNEDGEDDEDGEYDEGDSNDEGEGDEDNSIDEGEDEDDEDNSNDEGEDDEGDSNDEGEDEDDEDNSIDEGEDEDDEDSSIDEGEDEDDQGNSNDEGEDDEGDSNDDGEDDEGDSNDEGEGDEGDSNDEGEDDEGDSNDEGEDDEGDSNDEGEGDEGDSNDEGEDDEGDSNDEGEGDEGDSNDEGEDDEGDSHEDDNNTHEDEKDHENYEEDDDNESEQEVNNDSRIDERKAKECEVGKQRRGGIQKNKGTNVQTTDSKNHRIQKDICTFKRMTPMLDSGQLYSRNMKDCCTQTDTRMWSLSKARTIFGGLFEQGGDMRM